jgi:hypothetical protein
MNQTGKMVLHVIPVPSFADGRLDGGVEYPCAALNGEPTMAAIKATVCEVLYAVFQKLSYAFTNRTNEIMTEGPSLRLARTLGTRETTPDLGEQSWWQIGAVNYT